jgi:CheY-like chemotaxis protein
MEKKKILIVDDEKDFTDMVKLNLEESGQFNVRVENKGSQAYSTAKSFKPDLILLDIIMPDEDGGSVLYKLESDRDLMNIPVVFLTAIVNKGEGATLQDTISGKPFLSKPVAVKKLIDCVRLNAR